jgi:hypothetical protein
MERPDDQVIQNRYRLPASPVADHHAPSRRPLVKIHEGGAWDVLVLWCCYHIDSCSFGDARRDEHGNRPKRHVKQCPVERPMDEDTAPDGGQDDCPKVAHISILTSSLVTITGWITNRLILIGTPMKLSDSCVLVVICTILLSVRNSNQCSGCSSNPAGSFPALRRQCSKRALASLSYIAIKTPP